MAVQGTLLGYNPQSRFAIVDVPGRGRVSALNYLPEGQLPDASLVNILLPANESGTILPSETYRTGDQVGLLEESGNWSLLGLVVAAPRAIPEVGVRPGPGPIDIVIDFTTDGLGKYTLKEVGERAQLNTLKVVAKAGGDFTLKMYNGQDQLQGSWGDGDIPATDQFHDPAGFPWRSVDRHAHLILSPAGEYHLELTGERFA